jgi:small conductance mechanosensitive channel
MDKVFQIMVDDWHQFVAYSPRLFIAIVVLYVSYLFGKNFSRIVIALLRRTSLQDVHEPFFRIATISILLFVGVIIALNILGLEKLAVSVLAGGGLTAIVLGFAFREIGENFLAGLFLAFSRPFKIGDTIKTEDIEGKVQDIELRYTHLRTDDGTDVYVPSSQLFNKTVTNFTKDGLRRISFSVGIDYANNTKLACEILQNVILDIEGVLSEPKPGAYILELDSDYVDIQVFFWVDIFNKDIEVLNIRTNVMDQCRKTLLDEGYTVSSETTTSIDIVSN